MNELKVRQFLRDYMFLLQKHEEIVVDFVRHGRLREGPRLVIWGGAATGKTRLKMCLEALLADMQMFEGESLGAGSLANLVNRWTPVKPMLVIANSWEQAQTARGFVPCMELPSVWIQKLVESGVAIGAIWEDIRRDGAEALKEDRSTNTR